MYLSHRKVQALQSVLTGLSEPKDEDERNMRLEIGPPLLELLEAQYYVSYIWSDENQDFREGQSINFDPDHLKLYERYYQFHDPITSKMQVHREAVRATDVMAQSDLQRTEFFNDFLSLGGLHWGVNLYAWSEHQNTGDIRIWRDKRRSNFSVEELALLSMLRAPFQASLKRLRLRKMAVPRFHRLVGLSCREIEVTEKVVQGLSDKEICRTLNMALPTVRTHLRNIFRKYEVDSRIKLVRMVGPPVNDSGGYP